MGAVDLRVCISFAADVGVEIARSGSTFSMASLTRSVSMRPFCARLVIRDSLVVPELLHAMLRALVVCRVGLGEMEETRRARVGFVREDTMVRVHRVRTMDSFW